MSEDSSPTYRQRARAFGGATLDVGLTVLGLLLVLGPTIGVLTNTLGDPLTEPIDATVTLLLAIVCAYPFVARELATGWLGTFVLAFWIGLFAVGVSGAAVVIGTGIDLAGNGPRPQLLLVGLAHLYALLVVSVDDVELRRSSPQSAPDAGRNER